MRSDDIRERFRQEDVLHSVQGKKKQWMEKIEARNARGEINEDSV